MGFYSRGFLIQNSFANKIYIWTCYIEVILLKNACLIKDRFTYVRDICNIIVIKDFKIDLYFSLVFI